MLILGDGDGFAFSDRRKRNFHQKSRKTNWYVTQLQKYSEEKIAQSSACTYSTDREIIRHYTKAAVGVKHITHYTSWRNKTSCYDCNPSYTIRIEKQRKMVSVNWQHRITATRVFIPEWQNFLNSISERFLRFHDTCCSLVMFVNSTEICQPASWNFFYVELPDLSMSSSAVGAQFVFPAGRWFRTEIYI